MKIVRTSDGGDSVEESSIYDCITGLEKIICAVFASCGKHGVHDRLTEIVRAVTNQVEVLPESKNLGSLDLLMMVDNAAERIADVAVDFTLYADSFSMREPRPASRMCFRVGKVTEFLSGHSCFFGDLKSDFMETEADRLYNLYRTKAGLNPLLQATNCVLYRNKKIAAAIVPLAPVSVGMHKRSASAKIPSVKIEERPKKRQRRPDQNTNDSATWQSELKTWCDRGATLLALSSASEQERQESESRNKATIQKLRLKNDTLSEIHSTLNEENMQLQRDLGEATEAQSNLEQKNGDLEAQNITLQTKVEKLQTELKSYRKASVKDQSKDLYTLKEVNKVHSQVGLKSEALLNLQESMEKRLKRGKYATEQQNYHYMGV